MWLICKPQRIEDMKKLFFVFAILLSFLNVRAQNEQRPERFPEGQCLGHWSDLTIMQSNISGNRVYCTIPVPPEGISIDMSPMGPGSPHFYNYLGSTVQIVFNYAILMADLETYAHGDEALVEIPVQKWLTSDGRYTTNRSEANINSTCYYYSVIRLE